jgi:hypothetical protein
LETILLVVRPTWVPFVVLYTHVLPTATGNGIESAVTNDPDPVFRPVPVVGFTLCRAFGDRDAPDAAEAAPDAVLASVWRGTSGATPFGAPPHPARATIAAPARTAVADPRLLM